MFNLISKTKYDLVVAKNSNLENSAAELAILILEYKTTIEKAAEKYQELQKQLDEALKVNHDIAEEGLQFKKELEKLAFVEVEKTTSTMAAKEFGEEETLKQMEEAAIEDVLEILRTKVVVSKEKDYSIHKITAKITIQDGN